LFSRYVSYEVAKKLTQGGQVLDLGGIRREITVLFLDIRGFTAISEARSPEEVVNILNSLFEIVNKVIFNHGGTLDKYIGDAVMAVFNAPLDMENHENQAVQVAVEIQRNIAEHAEEYEKLYGAEIGVGIGINSGEAVVGNIGTKERTDYTAIGDVVNIAARLEAKSEKGEILIGRSTKEKLSTQYGVDLKGLVNLDGKKEPIEVYRVEWK
jgi:adenylate cyclase